MQYGESEGTILLATGVTHGDCQASPLPPRPHPLTVQEAFERQAARKEKKSSNQRRTGAPYDLREHPTRRTGMCMFPVCKLALIVVH